MELFKIGVITGSFRTGIEQSIRKAAQIGAQGVQLYALEDDFHPRLPAVRKWELKQLIADEGLVISALCAEMGGFTYRISDNQKKVEDTKRIMDLALEMGANVVTAHIGVVPGDRSHPVWSELQSVLGEIGEYGLSIGATFAAETGPEPAMCLKGILDSVQGVGVNFDPANLVMVSGDDPVQGVFTLQKYIVHTHAKDGIMLRPSNPQSVYGGNEPLAGESPNFLEVPLGSGSVDFPGWLRALKAIGYKGFLTIEREVGEHPEEDIRMAMNFLKNEMALIG